MRDCFPSCCLRRYVLSTKCILFLRRLCLPQMAPMLLRFICTMVTYSTDAVGIQLHCKNKIFAKKKKMNAPHSALWKVFHLLLEVCCELALHDHGRPVFRAHWWGSFADLQWRCLILGRGRKVFWKCKKNLRFQPDHGSLTAQGIAYEHVLRING